MLTIFIYELKTFFYVKFSAFFLWLFLKQEMQILCEKQNGYLETNKKKIEETFSKKPSTS